MVISMRISGYTDFNLRAILLKNNVELVEFLEKNSVFTGKVIDVKSNTVKILLQNGKEFLANSNIPLENLLGEEVSFKVLKGVSGFVLQPKIEGTSFEKELDLKINNLINELNIQSNKENKDLIKEMIKQNIPVNNKNFNFLKENIVSFKILSNLSEEQIQNLDKDIENIENKEIREIVKNMYINKEGKNIQNILGELKNLNLEEKDILFLFKNNFKLNTENMKILDSFLKGENIGDLLNKINFLFNNSKLNSKNINFDENSFEEIVSSKGKVFVKENKNIKDIIKSIIKDFEVDKEVNIKEMKKNLEYLIKSLGLKNDIKLGEMEEKELSNINQKLEFLNNMSNEYMYFQIPFYYKEYKNLAEILINDKNTKKEKNGRAISIFISLNTNNLDRVDSILNYCNKELKILFRMKNENILKLFKLSENKLINVLNKVGIKNIKISYKIKEESESILSNLECMNNKFSKFDIWV
ncbi:hypothetical protein SAMN02744040_00715 [Tepidibacter thalassicus DSM 15285]|uniref:Hook-length control protein FliK n=2 Tax=Tepidibacter TaxID=214904 RepID=A0A1M5Q1R6_9FIRM|nr:hypothetical protein SAMN02744040_00715 [Tepidibacter thalassicus DSM 15285]